MSSMAEGNEGWRREDELYLGLEDERPTMIDQGTVEAPASSTPPLQEPIVEELDLIDHAHEQASVKRVEATDTSLPETPPPRHPDLMPNPSNEEETASIPDDTPSLHVSY